MRSYRSHAAISLIFCLSLPALGVHKLCEKGVGLKKVTVRSLNGLFCNIERVAYWAEKNCRDAPGYADSACHKNAMKALGKAAVEVPKEEIKIPARVDKVRDLLTEEEQKKYWPSDMPPQPTPRETTEPKPIPEIDIPDMPKPEPAVLKPVTAIDTPKCQEAYKKYGVGKSGKLALERDDDVTAYVELIHCYMK